jgi:glycine C-acetyltransferase
MDLIERTRETLEGIRAAGLHKKERVITGWQGGRVMSGGREVLNLCANNYLGLAGDPRLVEWGKEALERWGYGVSSVRFICGTQGVHRELEERLSAFLGMDDTILYGSCFDANGGLFETLLGEEDAIISDALNHASIIDGIRLSKAKRFRYKNRDLGDLEEQLRAAGDARHRMVVTDGVFSMDGHIAPLGGICDLAERYGATVVVDDSHATGFLGARGRGSHEHCGVMGRVDLITGTLGKALGGASGGFTSGRRPFVELLRQRSRPYLFSNSLAPMIAGTSVRVLELLESVEGKEMRERLWNNTRTFRAAMTAEGFDVVAGEHPIVPIMYGEAGLAVEAADRLLEAGVYVVAFSYPVVPMGAARIRTQMSAALGAEELERAVEAFVKSKQGGGW